MSLTRFLTVILVLFAGDAFALEPFAKLVPGDAPIGGRGMGYSVAVDGDYIVAGDPFDNYPNQGYGPGAVYVFRRSGGNWLQEAKLHGSQACVGCFAWSVDISGEVIVVSQPDNLDLFPYIGRAYVFRRSGATWVEEQVLMPSISYWDDGFSRAIAVHGDIIAVGAPGINVGDGRVFVFRWDGAQWMEETILLPSDAPTGRGFGDWVALHGNTIVAAAPPDGTNEGQWGSIYVFRYNGASWIQEAKVLPNGPCNSYCLRGPVAIDGDVLVGVESGKAAVFRRTLGTWVQEAQVIGADTVAGDGFGAALSVHGSSLLVGAPDADRGPGADDGKGAAYLFGFDGNAWLERAKLPRPQFESWFAVAVAVGETWGAVPSISAQTTTYVYCVAHDAPCIPAMSQWGILILALLVLVAGCARLRARAVKTACIFLLLFSPLSFAADPRLASPHHPEQLLVGFKEQTDESARQDAHLAAGGVLLRSDPYVEGLTLVRVPSGNLAAVLDAYERDPNVLYAEPDYLGEVFAAPNDTYFTQLWGMHNTGQSGGTVDADIDAPEAWDFWQGDANFRIAVLDTGVKLNHPDLPANIWVNLAECPGGMGTCVPNGIDEDANGYIDDFHGWNYEPRVCPPNCPAQPAWNVASDCYHGTHMSGIIGAVGNNAVGVTGVNWRCKIVPIKISLPSPPGFPCGQILVSDAIEALDYVIANNIKVSNNSYGWPGAYSQAHYDKIRATRNWVGHIFVAAAGNKGANNDLLNADTGYPASYNLNNIIAVAATNRNDGLGAWGSEGSAYGLTTVDLGAPGVDILSTMSNDWLYPESDYVPFSGTSMAAAHVTGVVGLVWSKWPTWNWTVVKNRVMRTARPITALSGKCVTGGVVNAFAALNDCNLNGIPDDQEVAAQTVPDCNANGIPDWCDVTDGLSADCEPDMIPDECQKKKWCCLPGISCGYASLACCTAMGGYWVPTCGECPWSE